MECITYPKMVPLIINQINSINNDEKYILQIPSFVAWCRCDAMSLQASKNEYDKHH